MTGRLTLGRVVRWFTPGVTSLDNDAQKQRIGDWIKTAPHRVWFLWFFDLPWFSVGLIWTRKHRVTVNPPADRTQDPQP